MNYQAIKTYLLTAIALLMVGACAEKSLDYYVIELDSELYADNKSILLNDLAESIRVIPVQTTDSVLLASITIAGTQGNDIVAYTSRYAYRINKTDGSVRIFLNKRGEGPKEYGSIASMVLESDTAVMLMDLRKYGFARYNLRGEFLDFTPLDSLSSYHKLPDGNYYATYPLYLKTPSYTAVYDKDRNFLRRGIYNDRREMEYNLNILNSDLRRSNGRLLYKDYFGDTIFQVTTEQDRPYLIIKKGAYKLPPEMMADFQKARSGGHNYIREQDYHIASKYYFLRSLYSRREYYDIWDMETGKLLYRQIRDDIDTPIGIPVLVNNIEIRVWPNYAPHIENNTIYCQIPPADVLKLFPDAPEDTNPMLLEVKLKE
ncbi:MAG: 6-bladed beta-propeller [Prevotellaceae bacterium]|jgi:hypothetical protein|nr:6-bladed beta-propeller [Prevotellaceae bacterium]